MVSMGDAGDSVEVATIGCERMVGMPLFLGGKKAGVEIFIQVPGEGLHLSAEHFQDHLEREPSLSKTLLLYTQTLLAHIAQASACNVYHSVESVCSWLFKRTIG